jgi:hypothetical protein
MGLDMYLYKRTYVQNWEHNPPEQQHQIEVKKNGVVRNDIKPNRICYITEQVAYWRKFNALHGWFVNECGGGIDECQNINVDEDKLVELLETLKKVSDNFTLAKELLPPVQGFFFGGDEIDEAYPGRVLGGRTPLAHLAWPLCLPSAQTVVLAMWRV